MPIYFKYGDVDGEASHERHGVLHDAFLNIDEDFLKLSSATSDTFLKLESNPQLEDDISAVGDWFHKLDGELLRTSEVAIKVDDVVLKLTQPPPPGAAAVELPAVQSDFFQADAELKISASDLGTLSADFIKLDAVPNLNDFKFAELKVSADFLKLSTDSTNAGNDFTELGNDLVSLGTGADTNESDNALKVLGADVLKIGLAFDAVALDFQKLGQDFNNLGGGAITTVADFLELQNSSATGPLGADFLKLEQDFQVLNHTLEGGFFAGGPVIGELSAQTGNESGHPMIDDVGHFADAPVVLKTGLG